MRCSLIFNLKLFLALLLTLTPAVHLNLGSPSYWSAEEIS